MITYVVGDLFTSPAKVLVNTVNTVGVMGKGIARDFKRIYPEMFEQYQEYCENGMLDIGKLWLYKTPHKWILNFPTKKHWRNESRVEYIEAGLHKFVDSYDSKGIVSVSFPMLGCGNGGLNWKTQVQPMMEAYLQHLPVDVYIHLHRPDARFVPEHRNMREIMKWHRSEPRYLPFIEFWEDVKRLASAGKSFETIVNEEKFTVSLDLFEQSLCFEYNSEVFNLHKESLEHVWAFMRPKGYFFVHDFPEELTMYVALVASFLQNLPYIRPILLSDLPDVTDQDIGLLLSAQSGQIESKPQMLSSA